MFIDSDQDDGLKDKNKLNRLSGSKQKHQIKQSHNHKRSEIPSSAGNKSSRTTSACASAANNNNNKTANKSVSLIASSLQSKSLSISAPSSRAMMPTTSSLTDTTPQNCAIKSEHDHVFHGLAGIRDADMVTTTDSSSNVRIAKSEFRMSGLFTKDGSPLVTCGDASALAFYHKALGLVSRSGAPFNDKIMPNGKSGIKTFGTYRSPTTPESRSPVHTPLSPAGDVFYSPNSRLGDRVEDKPDAANNRYSPFPLQPTSTTPPLPPQLAHQHPQVSQHSPRHNSQDPLNRKSIPSTDNDASDIKNTCVDTSAATSNQPHEDSQPPKSSSSSLSTSLTESPTNVSNSSDMSQNEKSPVSSPTLSSPVSSTPTPATESFHTRTPSKTTAFSVADILDPSKFTGSSAGTKSHLWNPWRPSSAIGRHHGLSSGPDNVKSPGVTSDGQGEKSFMTVVFLRKNYLKTHFSHFVLTLSFLT